MRTTIFRGKRHDGQWIEGGIAFDDYTDKVFITQHNTTGLGYLELIEVDPATVGQFTGVIDRNETRIFEGDRVRIYDVYGEFAGLGVVRWNELFSAWHVGNPLTMYGGGVVASYEVVGNIYDNPELEEAEE